MLKVLFGSQTGNARNLAQVIADALGDSGIAVELHDLGEVDPVSIHEMDHILIVTSTHGDGEAPDNASEWLSYLKFSDDLDLSHLRYAVLGLGDPYYPHFCQCGKDFDQYLSKHGGQSLVPRIDCDRYYEEQYGDWLEGLIKVLKNSFAE
jgi:sulfite reductase (NADPH) flavoprotein alpha-component